jgi:hypothetical protein
VLLLHLPGDSHHPHSGDNVITTPLLHRKKDNAVLRANNNRTRLASFHDCRFQIRVCALALR